MPVTKSINRLKKLCLLAMFLAINAVISYVKVPVAGNAIRFTMTFIVSMTVASIFNLPDCIIYAIAADIIGFLMNNLGDPFFIGYTLSAILGLVIYWIFLHGKINFFKILAAKLSVNVIVNVMIGSLWRTILYGKGFWYYVSMSTVKNLITLPMEVLMFYLFYICVLEHTRQTIRREI